MDDQIRAGLAAAGVDVDEALERFMGSEAMLERFLKKFPADRGFAALTAALTAALNRLLKGKPAGMRLNVFFLSGLAGGTSGYAIYKNGLPATAGDMRKYDVATYSSTTNSIRVCDTRITGYYEDCSPNPEEPSTITVLVSPAQAVELAQYESEASMHAALVYRGDAQTAQTYLDKQEERLNHG